MNISILQNLIKRALIKIKLPFNAVVKSSTSALLYTLQNGLSVNDRKKIESLQHYGFVSRLPAGTRVVVIPKGGKTENLVIVAEKHKTAISFAEGDVALERETGEYVWLKNGEIEIKADAVNVNCIGKATINALGGVELDGGSGNLKGIVQSDCICAFTGREHSDVSSTVKGSK